jgi:hypothetical protein
MAHPMTTPLVDSRRAKWIGERIAVILESELARMDRTGGTSLTVFTGALLALEGYLRPTSEAHPPDVARLYHAIEECLTSVAQLSDARDLRPPDASPPAPGDPRANHDRLH